MDCHNMVVLGYCRPRSLLLESSSMQRPPRRIYCSHSPARTRSACTRNLNIPFIISLTLTAHSRGAIAEKVVSYNPHCVRLIVSRTRRALRPSHRRKSIDDALKSTILQAQNIHLTNMNSRLTCRDIMRHMQSIRGIGRQGDIASGRHEGGRLRTHRTTR